MVSVCAGTRLTKLSTHSLVLRGFVGSGPRRWSCAGGTRVYTTAKRDSLRVGEGIVAPPRQLVPQLALTTESACLTRYRKRSFCVGSVRICFVDTMNPRYSSKVEMPSQHGETPAGPMSMSVAGIRLPP